jgi:hypothetical protein
MPPGLPPLACLQPVSSQPGGIGEIVPVPSLGQPGADCLASVQELHSMPVRLHGDGPISQGGARRSRLRRGRFLGSCAAENGARPTVRRARTGLSYDLESQKSYRGRDSRCPDKGLTG